VKSLANQTGRATEEIGSQVAGVQQTARAAAEAIRGVTMTIQRIDGVAGDISTAVREQSTATDDIMHKVSDAAAGGRSVTRGIGKVSGRMVHSGEMVDHLQRQVESLSQQEGALRRSIATFLDSVAHG
jgi:methyl-accepting chemotaxis protein